jgi:hypothetical protein
MERRRLKVRDLGDVVVGDQIGGNYNVFGYGVCSSIVVGIGNPTPKPTKIPPTSHSASISPVNTPTPSRKPQ